MKRTRFLLLPALALLLLIGLLGLGSQRLGLVHASGTTVQVTNLDQQRRKIVIGNVVRRVGNHRAAEVSNGGKPIATAGMLCFANSANRAVSR